jgi:hypothetical protein
MAHMTAPKTIFISHSSRDNQFARRLTTDLDYYGIKVWLDEADLVLGDPLTKKISDAIEKCDYFAIVLSSHSISSDWVRQEFGIARTKEQQENRNLVIPILLENIIIPDDLQEDLKDRVYADFTNQEAYAWTFQKLLKLLNYQLPFRDRLSILDDSLTVGWQNASWGYDFFDDRCTEYRHRGSYSVCARLRAFGGIAFAFRAGLNTAGFQKLEFYINGGNHGGQNLKVFVNDRPGNGVRRPVMLDPLMPMRWQRISIPLKNLDAENITIVKINISNVLGESTADFYLDDLSLVA